MKDSKHNLDVSSLILFCYFIDIVVNTSDFFARGGAGYLFGQGGAWWPNG